MPPPAPLATPLSLHPYRSFKSFPCSKKFKNELGKSYTYICPSSTPPGRHAPGNIRRGNLLPGRHAPGNICPGQSSHEQKAVNHRYVWSQKFLIDQKSRKLVPRGYYSSKTSNRHISMKTEFNFPNILSFPLTDCEEEI